MDKMLCPDGGQGTMVFAFGPDSSGVYWRWTSCVQDVDKELCALGARSAYSTKRPEKEKGGDPKEKVEEKSSEKTRAGRLRKRRGENPRVF
ncbi:hypothetical protein TNCV_1920641 [Trichonephila clavipes]|nr:hypothetical protein TNCV_1920641 [Trichonephila clavipes]